MTLGDAPDAVFRVWRNRLNIEYEAAALFRKLAEDLSQLHGEDDPVVKLCKDAEREELEHAEMCIEILNYSGSETQFSDPKKDVLIGPDEMSLNQQILYASLAMGCVTETLSTALLTEMLNRAEKGLVRDTIHRILKDEVKHSRIGWAELNRQNQNQDLSWIQPYIPLMIREALATDIEPMLSQEEGRLELSKWGILSPEDSKQIMNMTIEQVIRPGLRQFNLAC